MLAYKTYNTINLYKILEKRGLKYIQASPNGTVKFYFNNIIDGIKKPVLISDELNHIRGVRVIDNFINDGLYCVECSKLFYSEKF